MVVDLSDISDFRAFMLPDPYRVVVDLPDFNWRVGNISNPPGNSLIQEVRTGQLQPGISRMVVDLSGPAVIRSAFLLPAASGKSNRLVIDMASASQNAFHNNKDKIFGNLDTAAPSFNLRTADPGYSSAARTAAATPSIPQKKPVSSKRVIIVDPGHGGQDPGAVGANGIFEKDVVLAAAKELKRQLEMSGRYIVHLTRENDRFIKLHERVNFARQKNGDMFISIHADSINKSNIRGASIYTLSDKASDAQTARLAARENRADLIAGVDLSHEDTEVANILIDLAMRDTMNQSKYFANTVVTSMQGGGIRLLERPHRYAGFAVLKAPDIPSVLVEIGFMSNRYEARELSTPAHRRKIASALVDSIDRYFEKVQKNNKI